MRTALVTGSAKGIGRAILLALAREGYAVAVHYRTSEALAEATRQEAEALGVKAIKVRADLTREEEVDRLVEEVRYHLGGVGVLVNNVGDYLYKPIEEVSLEEWRWILDTNLTATFLLTQRVLPLMVAQGFGRIVNIGSVSGLSGNSGQANYAAAKAGLVGFTKTIAKEMGAKGITANVVAPGFIETDMTHVLGDAVKTAFLQNIPVRRLGKPEEIAAAVAYVSSDEAGFLTSQTIVVDGGMTS